MNPSSAERLCSRKIDPLPVEPETTYQKPSLVIILHWSCRLYQFRAARVEREGLRPNGHLLRNLAPGILNVQGYSESSFLSFWSSEGKVKMDQNRRDDLRLGDPPGPASRDSGSC